MPKYLKLKTARGPESRDSYGDRLAQILVYIQEDQQTGSEVESEDQSRDIDLMARDNEEDEEEIESENEEDRAFLDDETEDQDDVSIKTQGMNKDDSVKNWHVWRHIVWTRTNQWEQIPYPIRRKTDRIYTRTASAGFQFRTTWMLPKNSCSRT